MQGSKQSAEVTSSGDELGGKTFFHVAQLLREKNLVLQLGARPQRDADELGGFLAAIAPCAFDKIAGGRDCSATHLAYQTIPFFGRVALSRPIDRQRQLGRLLPRAQLPIVSQPDSTMASHLHCDASRFVLHRLAAASTETRFPDSR